MMALILEQTEMSTIFGSEKCLLNVLNQGANPDGSKPEGLRFLKNMIVFDKEISEKLASLCKKYDIKLYLYSDLIQDSKNDTKAPEYDHTQTKRDAIFTISYTSGTENNPKGAMLTN